MLGIADNYRGLHSVVAAGNEAGKAHHYYGNFSGNETFKEVEILVAENTSGFCVEFWSDPPEVYAVGFESPLGEIVQKLSPRISFSENISFILENTKNICQFRNVPDSFRQSTDFHSFLRTYTRYLENTDLY